MPSLVAGDTVRGLFSDETFRVGELLGSGGQAEVYATENQAGDSLAVKHFLPRSMSRETIKNVTKLAKKGRLSERFARPIEPVRGNKKGSFGYVMSRVPSGYVKLADHLPGRVKMNFRTLCKLSLNIVTAMREVHAPGRCFADFSGSNFAFDANTGEVKFFDTDNIVTNNAPTTILGTPDYMARELFPQASNHIDGPNIRTDQHSMAVVLFQLWMRTHPLEGSRMLNEVPIFTREALVRWHGHDGTFAFDPSPANSNPPDERAHATAIASWQACPPELQALFTQAFTDGLNDPHCRVGDAMWSELFAQLPDYLFVCPHCQADNFHQHLSTQLCWSCSKEIRPVSFLRLSNGHVVCLSEGTELFAHHLKPATHRFCYDAPLAAFERHPDGDKHGFRNCNGSTWIASPPGGKPFAVPSEKAVIVNPGLQIHFGSILGEVHQDLPDRR